MALAAGARLGPYEIFSALGAGGMGEVYRAKDTKLGRDVALKILPDTFTNDPVRLARFRREAQVLASLNHPHIGAIYGLDEANGQQFLVLELVDGESLDKLIARGPIPPDEVLGIASQIAEALEAAHEKGIIHRDLKPANIALTRDGNVKVLDFGLAKPIEPSSASSLDVTKSPTITTPAIVTSVGVILGTAAYMSPEQAKGQPADRRSDAWAFGCVLYEMLSGRRAFEGEDGSDTLAAVLKSEPDWRALPTTTPPLARVLIHGCVQKDPKRRIGDFSTSIALLNELRAPIAPLAVGERTTSLKWITVLAVAALSAAAIGTLIWRLKPQAAPPVARFTFTLPSEQQLTLSRQAIAISPDGKSLAYAADGRLYLRAMSDFGASPITAADIRGALNPAFAPDGRSLAFWADQAIKRIAITGGAAVTICSVPAPFELAWTANAILFSQPGIGIMRVSPDGGTPEVMVALKPPERLIQVPDVLPGGRAVLFAVTRSSGSDPFANAQVVVQSLTTGERKTLIEGGSAARYAPTGHIIYTVGGTLFAVPFDVSKLAVTGGPVPIVEGVRRAAVPSSGAANYAFSDSGSLVYVPGPAGVTSQELMLFDRKGTAESLALPSGSYEFPRVSPDGTRVAFQTTEMREATISIYELSGTSSARRLTFGGNNRFPIWSADGKRIVFQSDRDGAAAVFWQPADGGAAERLTKPDAGTSHIPESWSPTTDAFLFSSTSGSRTSLWVYSLHDRRAIPFDDVGTSSLPTDAVFSPDGRWVAYQTGDSGPAEGTTFVQPFPPNGTKYEIARGGRPVWSRDGRELFYIPAPGRLMVVAVRTQPTLAFTAAKPVPRGFGASDPSSPRPFDIMPDGRILGVRPAGQASLGAPARIDVVLNWFEELKARVPTK